MIAKIAIIAQLNLILAKQVIISSAIMVGKIKKIIVANLKIVKALECCNDCNCGGCPCLTEDGCKDIDYAEILDLINRLQAENERLKEKHIPRLLSDNENINTAHIKAEAYKEFAERLNNETFKIEYCGSFYNVVDKDDIDNLLKELVGEDN